VLVGLPVKAVVVVERVRLTFDEIEGHVRVAGFVGRQRQSSVTWVNPCLLSQLLEGDPRNMPFQTRETVCGSLDSSIHGRYQEEFHC
jgi:hypothetical protein